MARHSKRARQRRRKDLAIGLLSLLVVFGVIGTVAGYMYSSEKPLDSQTLCPANGPLGHYVLLVDKTDPLNFTQKYAFVAVLHELVERRIPAGYLLSVFVLGEDYKDSAEPLIELCNPGSDAGKSEWTANLKRLRRKYEERFLKPLTDNVEALIATEPAKVSPIFEMIQLVGINAFRKHDVTGERRLIIMSDMLHNTAQYSMYRDPADFPAFSKSDYGKKSYTDLKSVKVELHYLINTPRLQTRQNLKFWEDYFNSGGAQIDAVKPLEG